MQSEHRCNRRLTVSEGRVFRTLWHEGWPYPVTAHPFSPAPAENYWYVQTRDGTWHAVADREPGTMLPDVWPQLESVVRAWLSEHGSDVPVSSAPAFDVQVTLRPAPRSAQQLHPLIAAIVNTDRGQCYAQIATSSRLPRPSAEDVATHAANREPTQLIVTFRTTNAPAGVDLQFDTADFLEAVVQEYLRRHPGELPMARPAGGNRG